LFALKIFRKAANYVHVSFTYYPRISILQFSYCNAMLLKASSSPNVVYSKEKDYNFHFVLM